MHPRVAMPKAEGSRKKAKARPAAKAAGGSAARSKKPSARQLFAQAQHALAYDQFDAAKDLLRQASRRAAAAAGAVCWGEGVVVVCRDGCEDPCVHAGTPRAHRELVSSPRPPPARRPQAGGRR